MPTEDPRERGRYRIEFPRKERPTLIVGDAAVEVMDCSESGLRYAVSPAWPPPEIGSDVHGVVRFRGGDEVEVTGVVTRLDGQSAALRFTGAGIPFSTILSEQQALRRRYAR